MALLTDMPRNASLYAKGHVKCLSLGRQEFDSMLGPLTDVLDRNTRTRILRTVPSFASKSQEALEFAVSQLEIKAFHDGQCIYRQNDMAIAFYIVKSGCVKLVRKVTGPDGHSESLETLLKANDTFGEDVFDPDGLYLTTAVSCGRSQCQRLKISSLARSGSRQLSQVSPADEDAGECRSSLGSLWTTAREHGQGWYEEVLHAHTGRHSSGMSLSHLHP
jgi:CRP-like cAMP-binding protein